MAKSLLDKAKQAPIRKIPEDKFSQEDVELVLAWLSGEIGLNQLAKANGFKYDNQAYTYIARVLRQDYLNGRKK